MAFADQSAVTYMVLSNDGRRRAGAEVTAFFNASKLVSHSSVQTNVSLLQHSYRGRATREKFYQTFVCILNLAFALLSASPAAFCASAAFPLPASAFLAFFLCAEQDPRHFLAFNRRRQR